MGAPVWLAQRAQAAMGAAHFTTAIQVLKTYKFEENRGTTVIAKEPIGVCGFITPRNWPVNQIACKLASAGALCARPAARRRPQLLPSHAPINLPRILRKGGNPSGRRQRQSDQFGSRPAP